MSDDDAVQKFIHKHRIDSKRAHHMGMRYVELEVDVGMFIGFALLKSNGGTLQILDRNFYVVGYSSMRHPLENGGRPITIYLGEMREINTFAEYTPRGGFSPIQI